jgi:hypothetical protein
MLFPYLEHAMSFCGLIERAIHSVEQVYDIERLDL